MLFEMSYCKKIINIFFFIVFLTLNFVLFSQQEKINESLYQETKEGNFITDAMLNVLESDIAFINGESIGNIESQGIKNKQLNIDELIPFPDDKCVKISIKGSVIKDILEWSVSLYPKKNSAFLQVAGINFTFNPKKEKGQKINRILINNEPLDYDKFYTAATTDFLANGALGYIELKKSKIISEKPIRLDEIIKKYINSLKDLNLQIEGRIKISED